jgi:hypothetical protein
VIALDAVVEVLVRLVVVNVLVDVGGIDVAVVEIVGLKDVVVVVDDVVARRIR